MINKIKAEIKKVQKGCGDEYLDDSGEWELMCGKHIWKSEHLISEYRLCSVCSGKIVELEKCLKWAEELEKELEFNLLNEVDIATAETYEFDILKIIQKAFHGDKNEINQ